MEFEALLISLVDIVSAHLYFHYLFVITYHNLFIGEALRPLPPTLQSCEPATALDHRQSRSNSTIDTDARKSDAQIMQKCSKMEP